MYDLKHELIALRMDPKRQKAEKEALEQKSLLEGKNKPEKQIDELLK